MKIVRRGNSESIFIWLVERRHAEGPRNPNQPPVQHHVETTLRKQSLKKVARQGVPNPPDRHPDLIRQSLNVKMLFAMSPLNSTRQRIYDGDRPLMDTLTLELSQLPQSFQPSFWGQSVDGRSLARRLDVALTYKFMERRLE